MEVTCLYDKFLFIQLHLCITHNGQYRDKQCDVQHPNNHSSQHHVHESMALAHIVILRFSHSLRTVNLFISNSSCDIHTCCFYFKDHPWLLVFLRRKMQIWCKCTCVVVRDSFVGPNSTIPIFPLILIFWSLTDKNSTLFTTYLSSLCLLSLSLSTTV